MRNLIKELYLQDCELSELDIQIGEPEKETRPVSIKINPDISSSKIIADGIRAVEFYSYIPVPECILKSRSKDGETIKISEPALQTALEIFFEQNRRDGQKICEKTAGQIFSEASKFFKTGQDLKERIYSLPCFEGKGKINIRKIEGIDSYFLNVASDTNKNIEENLLRQLNKLSLLPDSEEECNETLNLRRCPLYVNVAAEMSLELLLPQDIFGVNIPFYQILDGIFSSERIIRGGIRLAQKERGVLEEQIYAWTKTFHTGMPEKPNFLIYHVDSGFPQINLEVGLNNIQRLVYKNKEDFTNKNKKTIYFLKNEPLGKNIIGGADIGFGKRMPALVFSLVYTHNQTNTSVIPEFNPINQTRIREVRNELFEAMKELALN